MKRFPLGLTLLVIPAVAVLIGLGGWQLERLAWKNGLIAESASAANQPRVGLAQIYGEGTGLEFRRITTACAGLASAPFVEMRSIVDGDGGVRLYSLCRAPGIAVPLLVDRGFVADDVTQRPAVAASDAPLVIEGELREIPAASWLTPASDGKTFYAPEPAAMAEALGSSGPAAPVMIFATTSTNPGFAALRPSAPPASFSNNHLGYAMTWLGLALALVGVYVAMLGRSLSKPRAGSTAPGKKDIP